jgi:hypothetical protein
MAKNIPNLPGNSGESGADQDCGCGCAGNGGCEEQSKVPERRRFLAGGVTLTAFTATLASRRAFGAAQCQNLTLALISPTTHASHATDGSCSPGYTPDAWNNAKNSCWTAVGVTKNGANATTFSGAGINTSFSGNLNTSQTLANAVGSGGFAAQVAAAVLNIKKGVPNYPYATTGALITAIDDALAGGKSASDIANAFATNINLLGPIPGC